MPPRRYSAGWLRHQVIIQDVTRTSDGRGGVTEAWGTHQAVWAHVEPVSAREAFAQGQVQGAISHRVTIRYQSGIVPRMRILWGDRILLVQGCRVVNEERRFVEMDCVEERV